VLTTYSGDVQALCALKAGARAYLLKDTLDVELLEIIRAVHAGRKAISPEISFQLAEHATHDALTAGEVRVLALIADGKANKEIAKRLSISEATVKGQVQNILSKLGAKDSTHAAIGLKRGIIQPEVRSRMDARRHHFARGGFSPGIPASICVDCDHRGRSRISGTGCVHC
jgi:DNA-binding NarL/FixJ family response regulator